MTPAKDVTLTVGQQLKLLYLIMWYGDVKYEAGYRTSAGTFKLKQYDYESDMFKEIKSIIRGETNNGSETHRNNGRWKDRSDIGTGS